MGRRWCCVGGGGAARTCNIQNQPVTTTKWPNSTRNPSHLLHRPLQGLTPWGDASKQGCVSSWMQLQCSPVQPSRIFLMTCHRFSPGCNPTSIPWISQDVNLGKARHMLTLTHWYFINHWPQHTQNLMLFSHSSTSVISWQRSSLVPTFLGHHFRRHQNAIENMNCGAILHQTAQYYWIFRIYYLNIQKCSFSATSFTEKAMKRQKLCLSMIWFRA